MNRKASLPWNKYAQTNPLIVFCACIILFALHTYRENWIHLVPITVLGVSAGSVFIFWTYRLKTPGKNQRLPLLVVGYLTQILGVSGLLLLPAVLTILLIAPHWLERFTDGPGVTFWIIWAFTLVELVHNHVYKLTFGVRDTLERVLMTQRWNEIGRPFGGAIGQQLRKIRRNYARQRTLSRDA